MYRIQTIERKVFSPENLPGQGIVAAPKDVVWDIDDLSKQPPWKDNISGDITDLSDYFVTSGGEDFITLFFPALKKVEQFKNQYEAWRFSDSGEILSHRVFRDYGNTKNI